MKIAIISWGSLIKTGVSRGLQTNGVWRAGGPVLPIEFSRVSQSGEKAGCLTLVIDEMNGVSVNTLYAVSSNHNLDDALTNLRIIENISLTYSVGYVNLVRNTERGWARQHQPISCDIIKEWARRNDFDAVIWTGLLSNFEKVLNIPFSTESAVNYVNGLSPQLKVKALNYINESPINVVTPVRAILRRTVIPIIIPPVEEPLDAGEVSLMSFLNRHIIRR